ncbi:MAG: bifunctional phosphoribosylaminoimidazolecarboxamide formyltransferase/IMP cyclohydrolase [Gemmatales bacterium]|nr:bifunctional phosphoribosylaminoimidazolecarboxamide formyltransferase/IMP cyclohydrolase [Gemmatales bacterium]MDW8386611.1 bifunctional phosphoribosylaminoimidazolecarboxamide formyltransferase/IMP cyclohydrolase [Gemmatales bacterium]
MSEKPVRRALISTSQKIGLVTFAQVLASHGVELISTGGTYRALTEAGLKVREINDLTGFPEILDGRVKTLHPRVHGGILARRDRPEHLETLRQHDIPPIDMVVCNLYPFEETVAQSDVSPEEVIENIDIGGPTLVRAAAKNYQDVAVVCDPTQYVEVMEEMNRLGGKLSLALRERLAASAFERIAHYDRAIADWFLKRTSTEMFPPVLHLCIHRRSQLRYGENPHQKAAFYVQPDCRRATVATARQLHGKELSFNNILDLDSAWNLVREFADPAAVVIKHNNPCGAAIATSLAEAMQRAFDGDPVSAYGGVIGLNRPVDEATARIITEPNRFVEAIIAPEFTSEALEILTTLPKWKDSVRLLQTGDLTTNNVAGQDLDFRYIDGGFLVQTRDVGEDVIGPQGVVTQRQPTESEWADLRFAWKVVKHVKSNAIVFAKGGMVVGVGAGQMSRVDAVHLASLKAGERGRGAVMASDAFFPFRDNVDEAARAGITAIIQPGGSIRDKDSIQACNEHCIAMVFTGVRHFCH